MHGLLGYIICRVDKMVELKTIRPLAIDIHLFNWVCGEVVLLNGKLHHYIYIVVILGFDADM